MRSSAAARRLGISIKALRWYERRGLLAPGRTSAGYRVYGPAAMERAARIVALRALGLSLAEIGRMLEGDASSIDVALTSHERNLARTLDRVRAFPCDAARSPAPMHSPVSFELPWPWAGERFELIDLRPINYIVGPLGSGKTRFAQCIAQALPGIEVLGLEGLAEDGLDHAAQEVFIARLRQRAQAGARPLFLMTRSSAILNLADVGSHEAIYLCPANHNPPTRVAAYPGAPGYEAVATCLASPAVRARTAGVIAWRPGA